MTGKSMICGLVEFFGFIKRRLEKLSNERFLVLMYHRIIPEEQREQYVQAGMYVTPDTFREHVKYLKKGFDILSLAELFSLLNIERRTEAHRPRCVLTFDDGWIDFYNFAFPILCDFDVPATIFLPTGFIGTKQWFWSDRVGFVLSQLVAQQPCISPGKRSKNPIWNVIRSRRGFDKRLEAAIDKLKTYRTEDIEQILDDVINEFDLIPSPEGRAFLSWEEVREMRCKGRITFGSHTCAHRILTTLRTAEVRTELTESRERLLFENAVGEDFIPFCYPNGNYNAAIVEQVKQAGYHVAVSTNQGWVHYSNDPMTFARVGMHQDICSKPASFAARLAGIF